MIEERAQKAKQAGYTHLVMADCATMTLELLIRPDTDLDGQFKAFDPETGGYVAIKGWLWTFEDITPAPYVVTFATIREGHPGLEC